MPPRHGRGARAHTVPPMGFLPLERMRNGASTHFARACLTRLRSASRVSHPPGGLLRPDLPGLFHPGGACGVFPFRAFPSRGAVSPLGARCPPDVASSGMPRDTEHGVVARQAMARTRSTPRRIAEAGKSRLQGFAPLESPLPSSGGLGRSRPDALLGFLLFRGFSLVPRTAVLDAQLP